MNNEPVAWMFKYNKIVDNNKPEKGDEHNWIPLYTYPAKTLTDEEIKHLASNCFVDWKGQHIVEFASAILKKASFNCNGFCGEQECKEHQDGCKRIKKANEK